MIKSSHILPLFISFVLLIFSCQDKTKLNENSMYVIGNIEGLRKGDVYLQKVDNGLIINVDSVKIKGNSNFILNYKIDSPEIFYLYLKKDDGDSLNDRILFFGEKGVIEINTLLKTFESSAEITGSKNQELLQEYISFNRKFNDQNLDLTQKFYQAQIQKNNDQADSLQYKIDNLLKRRYLYTINFAANNTDENIAPYLALTRVFDANLALLDSIAVKMTPEVRESKYGKELVSFLEKRKAQED